MVLEVKASTKTKLHSYFCLNCKIFFILHLELPLENMCFDIPGVFFMSLW